MSDQFLLVMGIIIAGILISPSSALGTIANRLEDFKDAYQRRTNWLSKQDEARAKTARQRKQEKDEERERRYWEGLWEKLQQLQAEYLELESRFDGKDGRELKRAHRLAARIALMWVQLTDLKPEYALRLESFPQGSGSSDSKIGLVLVEYVERYMHAAGVSLSSSLIRNEYGWLNRWLNKAQKALDQRLRDLNTPANQSARSGEEKVQ
ncbi:MAG: hypothetical protein AAB486_00115 [Patescibacteria group bacterium]